MVLVLLLSVVIGLNVAETGVVFTLFPSTTDWQTAKANCEAEGQRLAVLDTEEKRTAMEAQGMHLKSPFSWIGFHDADGNDIFVWLNGRILSDKDFIFWRDSSEWMFFCGGVTKVFQFVNNRCDGRHSYICERDVPTETNPVVKAQTFNLASRNTQITGDDVVSLKVRSKLECGVECLQRHCQGFSFLQESPDGGTCSLIMTGSVTTKPLQGVEYYTTN